MANPRFEPAAPRRLHASPCTPRSLAELSQATNRCRECPIGARATQSVVGIGPLPARLMLVGEQPGDQEDLQGLPFVGPAGRLLAQALAQLRWPRDAVFVTNAVKHFKYVTLHPSALLRVLPAEREAAFARWLDDLAPAARYLEP